MARILVVDDDRNIRDLIGIYLRNEQYQVWEAASGTAALSMLDQIEFDLIVLDIMLPEMDGWELCRTIRQESDIPILMVTAQGEASHRIKGFRLGTDDYLVKPFDPQELVLRVKALLKRYGITSSQSVQAGELYMNRSTFIVQLNGETIMLPLKEFDLLFKLASNPWQIFTRSQLIEQIWGSDYSGDERTVDVHIKRIRERFVGKTTALCITTVRGLGYRLEVTA